MSQNDPLYNIYHVSYRRQTDAERVLEALTMGSRRAWEECPGCGIGCARMSSFTVAACSGSACRAKIDIAIEVISFDRIIEEAAQRRIHDA